MRSVYVESSSIHMYTALVAVHYWTRSRISSYKNVAAPLLIASLALRGTQGVVLYASRGVSFIHQSNTGHRPYFDSCCAVISAKVIPYTGLFQTGGPLRTLCVCCRHCTQNQSLRDQLKFFVIELESIEPIWRFRFDGWGVSVHWWTDLS